jgi:hypothetical protein
VVDISAAEGCPADALHGGGVKGQHAEAQAVAEAGPVEGEGVQPGGCRTAGAAEEAGAVFFPCSVSAS